MRTYRYRTTAIRPLDGKATWGVERIETDGLNGSTALGARWQIVEEFKLKREAKQAAHSLMYAQNRRPS